MGTMRIPASRAASTARWNAASQPGAMAGSSVGIARVGTAGAANRVDVGHGRCVVVAITAIASSAVGWSRARIVTQS